MIVLSVPATQVSVERLFSGLKYILFLLRTNINENILEDQLLVRANRIFSCKDKTYLCFIFFCYYNYILYIKISYINGHR